VKILNLSLGQDTGGQQMRLQAAWPKYHPEDEYLSVTSTKTFYEIKHRYNLATLTKVQWPNADVVHLNNDLRYIERFRRLNTRGKAVIVHHHGTMFRTRPDYHLQALKAYRATAIMSTVDLWAMAPEQTTWQPQTYDRRELAKYRKLHDDDVLKVAHAPTNRAIKGTNALIKAVDRLKAEGASIELDIIERKPNVQCLIRKGQADVYVDQMLLGYGCNAVEAWGMGIPVIAGVDAERCPDTIFQSIPLDTRDRMLQLWGKMPFMESTEEGLYESLSKMLSPTVRKYWADRGYAHFLRFHEASTSTSALRAIYEKALGT